jgi:hypothetical protein
MGLGIGGKLFKSEGQRQRAYRQQSAKAAARKFVDEVAFVMNKETRDSLRRTQRLLRDDLQARASSMHRSTTAALEATERASLLGPEERAARSGQLATESEKLRSLRTDMRQFATIGARASAGATMGAGIGLAAEYGVAAATEAIATPPSVVADDHHA